MSLHAAFKFDNTYAAELEGFYVPWQGVEAPAPAIVKFNTELAMELGLDPELLDTPASAALFAGWQLPDTAAPLAQAYAGHQFGGFSAQLGDGRALLIGELIDVNGNRRDIQLKGSGRTPFSRGGDGKAALGPVLREYLMGEAMHALGIPTTRALAAVTTGEEIMREEPLPGAVLTRVASSHLRVGTFQFFAARGETEKIKQLADYAIKRHYPELEGNDIKYLEFLREVIKRQASLVAKWMSVGFIHGVMNTDNVTISGETIDYGPCAFIDSYDPNTVFSSIDHQGRYAYGNQPVILQWNLARFAETLLEIIDPDNPENAARLATNEINKVPGLYQAYWLSEMRLKLGLTGVEPGDFKLVTDLHKSMEGQNVDFTILFRNLALAARGDTGPVRDLFQVTALIDVWILRWQARLTRDGASATDGADAMDQVNPIYIPRNHLVEAALKAAVRDNNLVPFDGLYKLLKTPTTIQKGKEEYTGPAPEEFGQYQTFCGT